VVQLGKCGSVKNMKQIKRPNSRSRMRQKERMSESPERPTNVHSKLCSSQTVVYTEMCDIYNLPTNNKVIYSLKQNNLDLNVDALSNKDADPLFEAVKSFTSIKVINLYSQSVMDREAALRAIKPPEDKHGRVGIGGRERIGGKVAGAKVFLASKDISSGLNSGQKSRVGSTPLTPKGGQNLDTRAINKICSMVGKNLTNNPNLVLLRLHGLRISLEAYRALAGGFAETNSLKHLSINNCRLGEAGFQILLGPLEKAFSLSVIDLSNNNLGSRVGDMIGKLISAHSQRRDLKLWEQGLRDSNTKDHCRGGLFDVNLSNNRLGESGVYGITKFLYQDTWIKSIDLRSNNISEAGIKELASVMSSNKYILKLDIRFNPGVSFELYLEMVANLQRNISKLRNELEFAQVEQDVIEEELQRWEQDPSLWDLPKRRRKSRSFLDYSLQYDANSIDNCRGFDLNSSIVSSEKLDLSSSLVHGRPKGKSKPTGRAKIQAKARVAYRPARAIVADHPNSEQIKYEHLYHMYQQEKTRSFQLSLENHRREKKIQALLSVLHNEYDRDPRDFDETGQDEDEAMLKDMENLMDRLRSMMEEYDKKISSAHPPKEKAKKRSIARGRSTGRLKGV